MPRGSHRGVIVSIAVLRVVALCFAMAFSFQGHAQTSNSASTFELTESEASEKKLFLLEAQMAIDEADTVRQLDKAIKELIDTLAATNRTRFVAHVQQELDKILQPARNKLLAKEEEANKHLRYAAVAVSSKGAGWVTDQKTKEIALEKARSQCGSGPKCDTAAFTKGCAGIYRMDHKKGRLTVTGFGFARAESEERAKQEAMARCHVNVPGGCKLINTVCQASK